MTTRHVIRAALQPILGSMFQPTGFPDVGAATFTRFDVTIQEGAAAGGSQAPVVNSCSKASMLSIPHFAAVDT